jgi:hypothetical protein
MSRPAGRAVDNYKFKESLMKRKTSVNKLSICRFRNADACELLSKKGGYSPGGSTGYVVEHWSPPGSSNGQYEP